MRYAKPGAEKSLAEIFGDFERLGICLFKVSDWERELIKPRLRSGEVLAPAPRMFVRADYWEALSRAERVMHVVKTEGVRHPTWIFTHATAAMAHGLEVPEAIFWPIHYATKRGNGNRSRAALRHHRLMELGEVELVGDVRVSGCSQTVIDCSRAYPFGQALAIADSALRLAKTSREGLRELLRAQPGRRGNRSARRVVEAASPLSESGGESIVRAHAGPWPAGTGASGARSLGLASRARVPGRLPVQAGERFSRCLRAGRAREVSGRGHDGRQVGSRDHGGRTTTRGGDHGGRHSGGPHGVSPGFRPRDAAASTCGIRRRADLMPCRSVDAGARGGEGVSSSRPTRPTWPTWPTRPTRPARPPGAESATALISRGTWRIPVG